MSELETDVAVGMGDCLTCGKPWGMTEGEKKFFENMITKSREAGETFRMPKHCKSCRLERKKLISPFEIIGKINWMTKQAKEGAYALDDIKLAKDLESLSDWLKRFANTLGTQNVKKP